MLVLCDPNLYFDEHGHDKPSITGDCVDVDDLQGLL